MCFHGVIGATMRKLNTELHAGVALGATPHELSEDETEAFELMTAIIPDMPPADIQEALIKRDEVENPGLLEDLDLAQAPLHWLIDCCSRSDAVKLRQYRNDAAKAKKNHEENAARIKKTMPVLRPTMKKRKMSPAIKALTEMAACCKISTPKGFDRWWNGLDGDATLVDNFMPPRSHCHTDDGQGRYRVTYAGEDPKSFSWTQRGLKAASILALIHLWDRHTFLTGEVCPIPLVLPAGAA